MRRGGAASTMYAVTLWPFTFGPFAPWPLKGRGPKKAAVLIPPWREKLSFAADGVTLTHPLPVTHSLPAQDEGEPDCEHPPRETLLWSIVTAALRARARPTTLVPLVRVMLANASVLPWKAVPV